MKPAIILTLLLSVSPDTVFIKETTPVVFTAKITGPSERPPDQVRLLRLQGGGSENEVCVMKGKDAYSCSMKLREPSAGMISYTAEASYIDRAVPIRSRPVFITVVGDITPKERKDLLNLQREAQVLYNETAKKKGVVQARKETVAWLVKQPGVVSVRTTPTQDLAVLFTSGITLWVKTPQEPTKP